jgi:hypothetical protein
MGMAAGFHAVEVQPGSEPRRIERYVVPPRRLALVDQRFDKPALSVEHAQLDAAGYRNVVLDSRDRIEGIRITTDRECMGRRYDGLRLHAGRLLGYDVRARP